MSYRDIENHIMHYKHAEHEARFGGVEVNEAQQEALGLIARLQEIFENEFYGKTVWLNGVLHNTSMLQEYAQLIGDN